MTKVRFTDRPEGTATMLPGQPFARNYYQWIVDTLSPYIGRRLLDIGGGYGSHLEHILPMDIDYVMSIDFSEQFVELLHQRFNNFSNFEVMNLTLV